MKNHLKNSVLYNVNSLAKGFYIFCITLLSSFALLSKATIVSHEAAIKMANGYTNPLVIFLVKLRIYLEKNPSLGLCVFVFVLLFYLYCERSKKENNRNIYIYIYIISSFFTHYADWNEYSKV